MTREGERPRVGFVGVGRMGANMALNLKDRGYAISAVYDVDPEAARAAAEATGASVAGRLASLTAVSDVVITVVTDDAAMLGIFAGKDGDSLLTADHRVLFVNCATVTPSVHVEVERLVHNAGAQVVEACMASSITQAREGTLYLMVGGEPKAFESAKPLLEAMSRSLRYIGPAGSAAQVKALVNMVMNINTAGLAEGLGLGEALGIDLGMLREVFAETGANSRVLETDGEDMQNREHATFFSAAHAAKDSHIATALAHDRSLKLPLAEATAAQYDRMIFLGMGDLDKSGIAELTFTGRGSAALELDEESLTPWERYVRTFHRDTPRATQRMLEAFADGRGRTSYSRLAATLDRMPRKQDLAILDLGSGDGRLVADIRAAAGGDAKVVALDIAGAETARGSSSGRHANFVTARAQRLPYEDASFDAVLAHFSLNWIAPVRPAVAEIERVLRPQGFFVAAIWTPAQARGVFRELLAALETEIERAGPGERLPALDERQLTSDGLAHLFAEAGSTRELRHEAVPFSALADAEAAWQFIATQYFFDLLGDDARARLRGLVDARVAEHGGKLRLETTIEFAGMLPPRGL